MELEREFRSNVPRTKPAYEALVVDDVGRAWLRLSTVEDAMEAQWLVVNLEGSVEATATLPVSIWLQVIRGNRAFGTFRDEELGAPIVAAYEITQ